MSGATSGNDSLNGTAGADTINGLAGADTINGLGGLDRLLGGDGNDWLIADGGDTVQGNTGADTIISTGDFNVLSGAAEVTNPAQGAENDVIVIDGDNNTVQGANGADTIFLSAESSGNYIDGGNGNGDFLLVSGAFTLVGGSNNNDPDILYTEAGANTVYGIQDGNITSGAICFAAGTDILTAQGEVAVEKLKAGDLVATLSGDGAPMKPVLWVGHRRINLVGNPGAEMLFPIRIKAGALGESTPHRDLLVSGDHCLYFDGALVPARLLVNGSSIVVERGMSEVHYYHVELESHDVLLAQGAAAESWLDTGNRLWFENGDVALMQVDAMLEAYGTGFDASRACAPLVHGGETLAAIRDAIAARALTLAAAEAAEEPLRKTAAA
jgi:hypothetical protein